MGKSSARGGVKSVRSGGPGRKATGLARPEVDSRHEGTKRVIQDIRQTNLEIKRRRLAEERDVEVPKCENPRRRARCRNDAMAFVRTYFKATMYLSMSEMHKGIIARGQMLIRYGGRKSLAAPRGHGKSTVIAMLALWAILYGHVKFFLIVCGNTEEAENRLEEIKHQLETNDLLMQDFPEVCALVRALDRSPLRARKLTVGGKFVDMEWYGDHIILPTYDGEPNSGGILATRGMDGRIRGIKYRFIRPDFVLLDDPETDKSVLSETETKKIAETIDKTIGGLAGPGKSITIFYLCTIMKKDCNADVYTDRSRKPFWNGERYKAIIKWPERMDLWAKYDDLRAKGAISGEDIFGREAQNFYVENRDDMDAGSEVMWKDNYLRHKLADKTQIEISALQHYMNMRGDIGESAFNCEYQNEPPSEIEEGMAKISEYLVRSRLSHYELNIVPEDTYCLVEGIDVRATEIHWTVLAVMANATSCVVDYGMLETNAPDSDLHAENLDAQAAIEMKILQALRFRREMVREEIYKTITGEPKFVELTLVDSGYKPSTIYAFCMESGAKYRPTKGYGTLQGQSRFNQPAKSNDSRYVGDRWYMTPQPANGVYLVHVDADYWKQYTHERFFQTPDTVGSCTLWGSEPHLHKRFARHICAEEYDPAKMKWVKKDRWNHFLDTTALSHCAASMRGVRLVRHQMAEAAAIRAEMVKAIEAGDAEQHRQDWLGEIGNTWVPDVGNDWIGGR